MKKKKEPAASAGQDPPVLSAATRALDMHDNMRVSEIAAIMKCSRAHAYQLLAKNKIPSWRHDRMVRVPRAAFMAWFAEQHVEAKTY